MPINYADIAILIILAFFVFKGLKNGFLQEFSMLFGILLGFFLAKQYASHLTQYFTFNMSENSLYFLSFAAIVLGTLILSTLLARMLAALLNLAFIGFIDHALGAVFGAIKGIILVCIIIYLLKLFIELPLLDESLFMPYYEQILDITNTYISNNPIQL